MLTLFSVSMPRAGHHVAEMVLGRLLGRAFAYCEFYTIDSCCKRIPCARISGHAAEGATLFMQKSHDHDLTDTADEAFDGLLIQVREPVARALSNYELDLRTVGPEHSSAYMRFWLGLEAAYTVGFVEKWCVTPDPRAFILKYEELLADPATYYRRLFERFGLPVERFDAAAVTAAQSVSSSGGAPFRERDLTASPYFDTENLADFQRVVARSAAVLGYAAHRGLLRDPGPSRAVRLAFEARRKLFHRDQAAALAALDAYLALPDAHVFARRIRAGLLEAMGDIAAAEMELRAVMAAEPSHARAYIELAEMQRRRGNREAARMTLDHCLEHAPDRGKTGEAILRAIADADLTAAARRWAPEPAVSREDVVAAFRFILGREPEGDHVIEAHQRVDSAEALREILLRSPEFADKYSRLLAQAAGAAR
jgi:tetratricopeptide (TPR) repeat protein